VNAEILDPMFLDLVDVFAELRLCAQGFGFTEGPVWDARENQLIFSDIPRNTTHSLSQTGRIGVIRRPSAMANGMVLDHDGTLLMCEHAGRRVARYAFRDPYGTVTTVADRFDGWRLNSPNDVVVHSSGTIYFTDPYYGLRNELKAPEAQEQPCQGVYRVAVDGAIRRVADDFKGPNGLAFSPDEHRLYVDDTEEQWIRTFAVDADGSLSGGRLFARLDESRGPGVADGMKVDERGNVFCTGPGGVTVFSPEGVALGVIIMPEITANLCFGGFDGQTLYLTATSSVYSLRVKTRAANWKGR
jgi:gluconolactonase